jgi:AcrR family transcriptional regulator
MTQERLYEEARRLLEAGGPSGLTVAAVAEAAGVSVGSVYRRFGDKDRLLAAVQRRFTADFRAELAERVAAACSGSGESPEDVIGSAVEGVAETFRAHGALMRVFFLLGTRDPAVFEHGSDASIDGGRTFRNTVMLVAPALRRHPDVEVAIDFSYRLAYAVCAHRIVYGDNLESARTLSWPQLIQQLRVAVAAYLLNPLADDRK